MGDIYYNNCNPNRVDGNLEVKVKTAQTFYKHCVISFVNREIPACQQPTDLPCC